MDSGPDVSQTFALISDFNISVLGRYLVSQAPGRALAIQEAPYGAVMSSLLQPEPQEGGGGLGMVWVRPEAISLAYRKALQMEHVDHDECLAEVEHFAQAVLKFATGRKHCFVASFIAPPDHAGYGLLDWRPALGMTHLLARMNVRLAEVLAANASVFVLDTDRWLRNIAAPSIPKLWYAAKLPYANGVFQRAAGDLLRALDALEGRSRRIVIVDLDNTMWGGVVGDVGWQGLRLGGHDHVGEAYRAFQEELKALTRRGIQIAVVSKNTEEVALEAIDQHPEMVLRRADLAGWRINWQDKAANVLSLLDELRLGLASAVFLDDNPVERDRVRAALPEVLVPEWPEDPSLYVQALHRLGCFDTPTVSEEDRRRTSMYASERARRELQGGSMNDWLGQLGTQVTVDAVSPANVSRVDQLFNKTNQLNLSTRRLSAAEIQAWAAEPHRRILACSVADKFGDLGLTGILAVEAQGGVVRLVDYVLSCRVMGRKVEETLLHVAIAAASELGGTRFVATYLPTARNAPTLEVLRGSGLTQTETNEFTWDLAVPFPKPDSVNVSFRQGTGA
jgi:FkbH-like protein